jgi:hypothetical protein
MADPRGGQPLPARPARQDLLAQVLAEAPRHAASSVRLNVAVAHQLGMAQADLQCMGLLAEGPSAPTRLAAALGLTTGAMTKVLDRLEAADEELAQIRSRGIRHRTRRPRNAARS